MKLVTVDELHPGDVLDRPVYGKNGLVMLEAGTELTAQYIDRLQLLGFQSVALGKRGAAAEALLASRMKVRPDDKVRDIAEIDLLRADPVQLQETHHSLIRFLETEENYSRLALSIAELADFKRGYRERLLSAVSHRAVAEELSVLRQTDQSLFDHTLQVSLMSGLIGAASGMDANAQYELAVGALLFDVGMTRISPELLRARRKLTDAEMAAVKQHTTLGYHALGRIREVPDAAAKCALLHHERYRGEGYPYGIAQDKIPDMAQIVGLSDVFDALLSPRHHRDPYPPSEAMEYMFAAGNYEFGIGIVRSFLKNLTIFPTGMAVVLSSGETAIVKDTANRPAHKPVVLVVREADGRVPSPYEIDLNENARIYVSRAVAIKG
ncbi:HD-GYP domain-containing protein [Cohnella sp. GbtcB17]|uniref:HD-GYP domain-containing protein n=1 Tax=Cohnella sp. GbtcB17 TaxID=2824762 RepID=UPI001C2F87DC|nr:HD domain-containing phosphohydrolase [Cohnella sp. GbtcB17]